MPTCQGCGKGIVWIRTKDGKNMPCNANPVKYWASENGHAKVVTQDGAVISCRLFGAINQETGFAYVPHWATCPKAEQFRKDKGDQENIIAICAMCYEKAVQAFPRHLFTGTGETLERGKCGICRKTLNVSKYLKELKPE